MKRIRSSLSIQSSSTESSSDSIDLKFISGLLITISTIGINTPVIAQDDLSDLSPEERAFLEDDSFFQTMQVQDSPIKWVNPQKTENQYALTNEITITNNSFKTGFVNFSQCHTHLDAIRAIDIVYNPETTQQLKVLSSQKIQKVIAHAASIELKNVEKGAEVCVAGKVKTFRFDQQNQAWVLLRGPYMRKFLDGYYPMHVQETIQWPQAPIKWKKTEVFDKSQNQFVKIFSDRLLTKNPAETPHPQMQKSPQKIQGDYWFEGKLKINYLFISKN